MRNVLIVGGIVAALAVCLYLTGCSALKADYAATTQAIAATTQPGTPENAALTAAPQGAAAGAPFGPVGMVVGALVSAAVGFAAAKGHTALTTQVNNVASEVSAEAPTVLALAEAALPAQATTIKAVGAIAESVASATANVTAPPPAKA